MDQSKNVCVLMGEWSAAREDSLQSCRACAAVLQQQGSRLTRIDGGRDIANVLRSLKPDAALNLVHGRPGLDGSLRELVELIGTPFSHCGALAAVLARQDNYAKTIKHAVSVPVGPGPAAGTAGAAAGGGRELTYAMMGDCALAVTELLLTDDAEPDGERASRPARHLVSAPLSPNVYQLVRKLALAAHRVFGCRGVSRADFSWDGNAEDVGGLVCLAIDTQPGMTETSLAPEIAAHAGISFGELVRWMVEDASF